MLIEKAVIFFLDLEQSVGLPLWVILPISILLFIFLFIYVILIPITAISVMIYSKKLNQLLQSTRQERERNIQARSLISNYHYLKPIGESESPNIL